MSKEKPKKAKKEPNIIGKAYEKLKHIVIQYAKNNYNVLFVGERGSGKELFANYFMTQSGRPGEKLSQNCAGVPDNLLESEILGHIRVKPFKAEKSNRRQVLFYIFGSYNS